MGVPLVDPNLRDFYSRFSGQHDGHPPHMDLSTMMLHSASRNLIDVYIHIHVYM